jgi:hypothetical protein
MFDRFALYEQSTTIASDAAINLFPLSYAPSADLIKPHWVCPITDLDFKCMIPPPNGVATLAEAYNYMNIPFIDPGMRVWVDSSTARAFDELVAAESTNIDYTKTKYGIYVKEKTGADLSTVGSGDHLKSVQIHACGMMGRLTQSYRKTMTKLMELPGASEANYWFQYLDAVAFERDSATFEKIGLGLIEMYKRNWKKLGPEDQTYESKDILSGNAPKGAKTENIKFLNTRDGSGAKICNLLISLSCKE